MYYLISWADSVRLVRDQRETFDTILITTFWIIWNYRILMFLVQVFLGNPLFFYDIVDKLIF